MSKRHLAVATLTAITLLAAPFPAYAANATSGTHAANATSDASTQPLKLRGGLTLHLPIKWAVHRVSPDWIHVVTGRCAKPSGGYGTPGCRGFWVLGPKAIKHGNELFHAYDGTRPFYPATDVQQCPSNGKWGQVLGSAKVKGLRYWSRAQGGLPRVAGELRLVRERQGEVALHTARVVPAEDEDPRRRPVEHAGPVRRAQERRLELSTPATARPMSTGTRRNAFQVPKPSASAPSASGLARDGGSRPDRRRRRRQVGPAARAA